METIRKIRTDVGDLSGALAAALYVLNPTDSPQALDRKGESGARRGWAMWLGGEEALAKYGLRRGGAVEEAALAQVMQGLHPETGEEVRAPGHVTEMLDGAPVLDEAGDEVKKPVVCTYDLTFSAPKSVSILWALGGVKLRARLEQAMIASANAAVEHLVKTRPVVDRGPAEGWVGSAAIHVTARQAKGDLVPMPQLHVHTYLLGVLDHKGDIRAPDNSALYKHSAMREAGAVGRAKLAEEAKEMGLPVEARTGRGGRYFEIAGVPEALREKMSGRTREIRAWIRNLVAAEGGELSNRVKARGALATRSPKGEVSAQFANEVWEAIGKEFFFGREEIEALFGTPAEERDVAALVEEMRTAIVRRIREEGPTVSAGGARSIAFETAPIGLTLPEAGEVLDALQNEGELISVDGWRVTTREIREQESFVRDVALKAAREKGPALKKKAIKVGVATAERNGGFELDDEQADAVRDLGDGSGWACLTGRAGTGKGPVLEAVAAAHRHEGWQVIATALDGATAGRLAEQLKGEALTVEQVLFRQEEEWIELTPETLVVIEEASKVGLSHWYKLAQLQRKIGFRVLAVGDIEQIGAIECPGMLDVMLGAKGMTVAKLETVRRHKDPVTGEKHPWIGEVADYIYEGEAEDAIALLDAVGALTMEDSREEAIEAMVDRWAEQRAEHRILAKDAVMVVDGSNEEVDSVNRLAQERRQEAGELGKDGVKALDREYLLYEGDVVMLREGAYRPLGGKRIENGVLGVVSGVDVDGDRIAVTFDLPGKVEREVWIEMGGLRAEAAEPTAERVASVRLAYAGHAFPLQGGTWRYVGALLGHWSQRKEEAYVALTRAKEFLDTFTDKESCGLEGSDADRLRRLAKRLERPWHRLASITWEETPAARIYEGVPEFAAVPELPGMAAFEEGPLRSYEHVLGAERYAAIERLAESSAEQMRLLDLEALREEREAGRKAAALLDPNAALEIERTEQQIDVVVQERDKALQSKRVLTEKAGHYRGWTKRRNRLELLAAAANWEKRANDQVQLLDQLRDRRDELCEEGRHPDGWIHDQGAKYARGLAAERELARRAEWQLNQDLGREAGWDSGDYGLAV